MPGFDNTLAAIPADGTRRMFGTAYWDGAKWWASINGSLVNARWLDPIQPAQDGKIVIDIAKDEYGLASALVIGGYTDQPRPSTGTIAAVGVSELLVQGADTNGYTTDRFLGALADYAVTDPVYLTWDAAKPTVMGVVAGIAAPREQAPPPTPGSSPVRGDEKLTAIASDTWGVGGWGRWSTSRFGGEDVYSGTWSGVTTSGAFFYGPPRPVLQGKTIGRVQLRLPARIAGAGANATVTVHVYAHTSESRPGGDVTRVVGPFDISIPAGAGPSVHDLPLTFAAPVQAGGGISIYGEPYIGFQSRLKDPEAGKLTMDWVAT